MLVGDLKPIELKLSLQDDLKGNNLGKSILPAKAGRLEKGGFGPLDHPGKSSDAPQTRQKW